MYLMVRMVRNGAMGKCWFVRRKDRDGGVEGWKFVVGD